MKPIEGFEGLYSVTEDGRVFSHRCGRYLVPLKQKYPAYMLCKKGVVLNRYAHRLVALAFIPNPGNLREVNHINGNKQDNRVENLEWVSSSENLIHAYQTGLRKSTKGIKHKPRKRCVSN